MKQRFVYVSVVLFIVFSGCTKFEKVGSMREPGIMLSFDDASVDNWYQYMPLLDSFGAKLTFYISNYHQLNYKQKIELREIENKGHEIAYHTTNHYNLEEYLSVEGIDSLIKNEIYDDLDRMRKDGFDPVTFAYPYGRHNDLLDYRLLQIFKSVRALNGTPNHARSCTRTTDNLYLYALEVDDKSYDTNMILKMMNLAKSNNNCLVLVAHQINNPNAKYSISYNRLKEILMTAKNLGLRFYTASEISKH